MTLLQVWSEYSGTALLCNMKHDGHVYCYHLKRTCSEMILEQKGNTLKENETLLSERKDQCARCRGS